MVDNLTSKYIYIAAVLIHITTSNKLKNIAYWIKQQKYIAKISSYQVQIMQNHSNDIMSWIEVTNSNELKNVVEKNFNIH